MSQLGDYLKKWRKDNNITLRELAEQTEVSHSTLNSIENDDERNPRLKTLVKIAHIVGIPVWQAIEMAGYESGLSGRTEIAQALASLAESQPETAHLLDLLIHASTKDREAVLSYLLIRAQEAQNQGDQQA